MGFFQSAQRALPGLFTPAPSRTADFASQWEDAVAAYVTAYEAGAIGAPLSIAAVYRARQMNASTVAALPLTLNGEVVPAPNEYQSWLTFLTEAILAMEDHGEAYLYINGTNVSVLPNDQVTVKWNQGETVRIYERVGNGTRFREDPTSSLRNLVVVPLNRGAGDLTGVGPMESGRITSILESQKYATEYFANNGMPTGTLNVPAPQTEGEAKLLQEAWIAARAVRSPAVLSGGMSYVASSFNMADSQWVEGHLVDIGDVASLFGVPSEFLNYSPQGSSLTYTNRQDLYRDYWLQTLWPLYAYPLLEAVASVWKVPVQSFEFDTETLFLPALADRSQAAAVLVAAGYDPDDVLGAVGLPDMSTVEVESDSPVPG